jgi:KipI family sensor histidine kinase inhibitor
VNATRRAPERTATWLGALGIRWRLDALGDGYRLAAAIDDDARFALHAAVRRRAWATRPANVTDVIPGERTLTIECAPGAARFDPTPWLRAATRHHDADAPPRTIVIPIRYDDPSDDDAAALSARTGLPWPELIALHAAARHRVAYLGFTPGFPYLIGTPTALATARRPTPRAMPSGSVATAAGRTGIYPSDGPGGWWRLGQTPVALFDPHAPSPTLLLPGDAVRFTAVTTTAPRDAPSRPAPRRSGEAALEVLAIWPATATLQGRPRPGVGHLGMAQAGALDPVAFARATRLAGAPRHHPALELPIPHATLRAVRTLTAAVVGGAALRLERRAIPTDAPFLWPAGAILEIRPDPRRAGAAALLAVGGGLRPLHGAAGHPSLQRGGSSDVRAGVGGFGRALTAGDALALAGPAGTPTAPVALGRERSGPLRLHPGSAGDAPFAALLAGRYRLERRDRMGARLVGGPRLGALPEGVSEGVPLGAVQWPPDGTPIVLLADRGRTGGYPLAGIVDARDLPRLARAAAGAIVRFVPAHGAYVGYDER